MTAATLDATHKSLAASSAAADPRIGREIPDVMLAEYIEGVVLGRRAREIFGVGHVLVAGAPGAFTPICSQHHIPNLIENADNLLERGFKALFCVVSSDPFSMAEWAEKVDPKHRLRFLSDGNLEFSRALNLLSEERTLFLGQRSARYALSINEGVIQGVRVEASILAFRCTRADSVAEFI